MHCRCKSASDPSQERLDHRRIDFDDLVGNIPVGFVMCFLKRILVGGVYPAKRLRTDLVMPIRYEANTTFALDCEVLFMRRGYSTSSKLLGFHESSKDASVGL
jgi:hypothetical protein